MRGEVHRPSFLVAGRRPVVEALRAGGVRRVWLAGDLRDAPLLAAVRQLAGEARAPLAELSRQELDRLTEGANHQGVVAEIAPPRTVDLADLLARARGQRQAPLLLAVDHLEDPQNLGALLRSAEAAGADGLVLPLHRAAPISPAVVRASAGAALHLPVAEVTNLTRALEFLKRQGLWVIGLDAAAPLRYDQADLRVPLVAVVGSEQRGLSRLVAAACDLRVSLPMAGKVASLNAAVAGAILLYEAVRQRT